MQTEILTQWPHIAPLEKEWQALLANTQEHSLFLTWEWFCSWVEACQNPPDLFLIAVRDNANQLVGIAPFYRSGLKLFGALQFQNLRVIGDYSTGFEYPDLLLQKGAEDAILSAIGHALLDSKPRWDTLWLPRMAGWTKALEHWQSLREKLQGFIQQRSTVFSRIALPASMADYEASLSPNGRQQLRRKQRKLSKLAGMEIHRCANEAERQEFLQALFQLHERRWQEAGEPGCFNKRPLEKRFYQRFSQRALEQDWLQLWVLKHDNVIQCAQLGYVYQGVFHQLQEGFNPDFFPGAGNVLRAHIIEHCINEGCREYDFLGGITPHKRRWGAEVRAGFDLFIGHKNWKNRLLFSLKLWPSGRFLRPQGLLDGNETAVIAAK